MEEMKQRLRGLITAAYAPPPRHVVQAGTSMRKTNMLFVTSGGRDFLGPEVGNRRFFVIDRPACTASGRVVPAPQGTPPVGTPGVGAHGGNSTPDRAPVAGLEKSEQAGERGAAK